MTDVIRVFVGTDPHQHAHGAEMVLEHSIRKHSSKPVEITWMRSNDPGWEISRDGSDGSWKVGHAVEGGWVKKPGSWGTCFSGFRFAVPETCNFEGHAIYLDADMLVLGDIADLWEMKPSAGHGFRAISKIRTDVSVIDCSYFKDQSQWPSIKRMKESGALVYHYCVWLDKHRALEASMPREWNDCDGKIYESAPESVKLLHFTNVLCGQPYRPYPNVDYSNFSWPYVAGGCSVAAAKLWWRYYQEALVEKVGEASARDELTARGGVWQDA